VSLRLAFLRLPFVGLGLRLPFVGLGLRLPFMELPFVRLLKLRLGLKASVLEAAASAGL
jgi:hypothetical protein